MEQSGQGAAREASNDIHPHQAPSHDAQAGDLAALPPVSAVLAGAAWASIATLRPGLTIADGQGGVMTLDLSCAELRWLADACQRLLSGRVPAGASALKAQVADKSYLLNRRTRADGQGEVAIANLFDPQERVALSDEMASLIAALIERAGAPRERISA